MFAPSVYTEREINFNSHTSATGLSVSLTSKIFSKFYRRHYELISKFNVELKTLLKYIKIGNQVSAKSIHSVCDKI